MRSGYTKAYRKELNSDIWKMPPLYQRVFFYLRQEAVWQPEGFPTRKGYGIALNPGQLITSYSTIADGVSWYEYGVKKIPNKKIIKDILEWLESNSMVTVFSNRHGTFIMLTNWDIYNSVETEKVTQNNQVKVTQKKRSVDTLKEGKEPLRSKEDNKEHIVPFKKIIFYLNEKSGKRFQPTADETKRVIMARWNQGYKLDDFKKVIDNKCNEWLPKPDMINYIRPQTLFGTKFESYLNEIPAKQEQAANGTKLPKVDYSDIRGRDD